MRQIKWIAYTACFLLLGPLADIALAQSTLGSTSTPYDNTVAFYHNQASKHHGQQKQAYQVQEAGKLQELGMDDRALQVLQQLSDLPPLVDSEKQLLLSLLYSKQGNTGRAWQVLRRMDPNQLPSLILKQRYLKLRAHLLWQNGDWLAAVAQRIMMDDFLMGEQEKLANSQKIWQWLSLQSDASIVEAKETKADRDNPELLSWLALSSLVRQHSDDARSLLIALNRWQSSHQGAMAQSLLPKQFRLPQKSLRKPPKQVALLLPLSGTYEGPGKAVRDGFMNAFYQKKDNQTIVRFYDTDNQSMLKLYNKAVADGADFVVGPLLKRQSQVMARIDLPVPTLVLNDAKDTEHKNLYQFAISPKEEVVQLAYKTYQQGHRRALVIAPEGSWGESLAQAFVNSWRYLGGEVQDTFLFNQSSAVETGIKSLLKIKESEARNQAVRQITARRPVFVATRRTDFDVVFILAYPSKARQIRPLLRYYYAGNIPVFAASLAYSGYPNPHADNDLNGISFLEMPWLIEHRARLKKRAWPEQFNSYNRLYAVGQDAYRLTQQLAALKQLPLLGLNDSSGRLYLGDSGKIHRELMMATFEKGQAKPSPL